MNAPHPKALFEKISALPSERLAEIEVPVPAAPEG